MDHEDLTAALCDACGNSPVRARAVFALPSGRILTVCWHHANKHRAAITAMGGLVVELRTA